MYHKVNDVPGNPLTMPVSLAFDEQMDHCASSATPSSASTT